MKGDSTYGNNSTEVAVLDVSIEVKGRDGGVGLGEILRSGEVRRLGVHKEGVTIQRK